MKKAHALYKNITLIHVCSQWILQNNNRYVLLMSTRVNPASLCIMLVDRWISVDILRSSLQTNPSIYILPLQSRITHYVSSSQVVKQSRKGHLSSHQCVQIWRLILSCWITLPLSLRADDFKGLQSIKVKQNKSRIRGVADYVPSEQHLYNSNLIWFSLRDPLSS